VPASVHHLQTPFDRREAFAAVMAENGLACPAEWTLECDWTADGAAADADRMFSDSDYPTCVVAASDEMAFGVMSAARRHGLSIPGDVSVIGIDDHVHARIFDLTTVRQDVEAQGRRAGALMLTALHGRDVGPGYDDVLDVELVVRGSTGPPRVSSVEAVSVSGSVSGSVSERVAGSAVRAG
jgi:LacI family repressor for deo operon, udp, cdd, tsx, nupC, and nupG